MPLENNFYKNIVVLTGAGISAESGIRTFRASDGLWEDHRIEDVASPEGFIRDPETVHRFYNLRRDQLVNQGISPNPGHISLAEFEAKITSNSDSCNLSISNTETSNSETSNSGTFNSNSAMSHNNEQNLTPRKFTLITQNIDDLHEQAGSNNLYHMHGELLKIRCQHTEQVFTCRQDTSPQSVCECCSVPGNLRPHVVWFGEMPLFMDEIYQALQTCDLFIAIGTSGNVYPAAGFFELADSAGAHTVELNLEPSTHGSRFKQQIYGPASEVVPHYLSSLA